jgi:hypothetical protein
MDLILGGDAAARSPADMLYDDRPNGAQELISSKARSTSRKLLVLAQLYYATLDGCNRPKCLFRARCWTGGRLC